MKSLTLWLRLLGLLGWLAGMILAGRTEVLTIAT